MKKTIIFLILIIPLLLVVSLFSIGKAASLSFDIPVSGINIITQTKDGFLDLDMATYENDIQIVAKVEPSNASNKGYTLSVESVDDNDPAVELDSSGKIKIKSLGKAKIVATSKDKGFKDSVIVNTYSTKVVDVTPLLLDSTDHQIALTKLSDSKYRAEVYGGYYNFSSLIYPSTLSDAEIIWSSSDDSVATINEITGATRVLTSGTTTITAVCLNSIKGSGIVVEIELVVSKNYSNSNLLINGLEDCAMTINKDARNIEFFVERTNNSSQEILINGNNISYTIEPYKGSNSIYKAKVTFNNTNLTKEDLSIGLAGESNYSSLEVNFEEFSFNVFTSYHKTFDEIIYQKNATNITYVAQSTYLEESVTYVWQIISGNSIELLTPTKNGLCTFKSLNLGTSKIKVDAVKDGTTISSEYKTIKVVDNIIAIEFSDNQKTYGIENLYTISNKTIKDSVYIDKNPDIQVRILTNTGIKSFSPEELIFTSSNPSILNPFPTFDGLKMQVKDTGIAQINVEWKYNKYFKASAVASIKLRGVLDAVTVFDNATLKQATEDGKKIVLSQNIMLGKENMSVEELKQTAKLLPTTYDWQFYLNEGKSRPSVYYLIEFKDDVYGNGYFINANNITQAKDATGTSLLFKGPINFVSIATASIKAQDNISFLVRNENVLINNITLLGCSDSSLYEKNVFDLSKLNNVGTTLEIVSSCNITNSRISNGRTVLRIFGGKTKDTLPIHASASEFIARDGRIKVTINGTILTNAREFIVKIGSNRALLSQGNNEQTFAQTKLTNASNVAYNHHNNDNWKDPYFYDNYVTTDVTIQNSTLSTSGFFSIGMETHFSGIMLSGNTESSPLNWKNLAATSYASVVHLVGDVKLLDWKDLDNLDSSTLIETTVNAQKFLTFDVKAMLNKVSTKEEYSNLIYKVDEKCYVHGGIALYGGGYNYSCVDISNMTGVDANLNRYRANLSILAEGLEQDLNNSLYLQGTMLPLAAGHADFEFFMYNKDSLLNYEKQKEILKKGSDLVVPIIIS